MHQQRKRTFPLRLDRVNDLVYSKGLSTEDLARKLDVDLRNIRRWLSGGQVYLKNIARLAEVLDTTPDEIGQGIPRTAALTNPAAPIRFDMKIRLKGFCTSEVQKAHLARVTHDVQQALAREGITLTGQKTVLSTPGFAMSGSWRFLVAVPTRTNSSPTWTMLAVIPSHLAILDNSQELDAAGFEHGEIIESGPGLRAPLAVLERVARLFHCDVDSVLDLTEHRATSQSR